MLVPGYSAASYPLGLCRHAIYVGNVAQGLFHILATWPPWLRSCASAMQLKLSFAMQLSRSVTMKSGDRTSTKLIRRVRATLRRIRFLSPARQPAMADRSSGITDTDSSWLGPPPGYDEVGGGYTCLNHLGIECWSETDLRMSESEIATPSATVDGPLDLPAVTCWEPPNKSQTRDALASGVSRSRYAA